jgi:hypothetical protein
MGLLVHPFMVNLVGGACVSSLEMLSKSPIGDVKQKRLWTATLRAPVSSMFEDNFFKSFPQKHQVGDHFDYNWNNTGTHSFTIF